MSQTWDIDLITPASTSPATDIQRIIDGFYALRSIFSGASEPGAADRVAYMLWADTTTGLLKIRNAADSAWITIGTLASTNLGLLALAGANMTGGVNMAKTTVASAATPDIFATTVGNVVDYTGTTTCTGFTTAPQAGCRRLLVCAAAAPFTAGANLLIKGVPSGSTYTAVAGETLEVIALTTTQFQIIPAAPITVEQNSKSAAYTTVMSDANKHILHPTADNNARTFTIDSNANVPYPIGTTITFVNQINTVTIAITSNTLTLAGAGTTGSRTLAANGMATALKIGSTSWIISGTGLS